MSAEFRFYGAKVKVSAEFPTELLLVALGGVYACLSQLLEEADVCRSRLHHSHLHLSTSLASLDAL